MEKRGAPEAKAPPIVLRPKATVAAVTTVDPE
jgi:hypothetical protein